MPHILSSSFPELLLWWQYHQLGSRYTPREAPLVGCQDFSPVMFVVEMPGKGKRMYFSGSDTSRMKDRKWANWTHSKVPPCSSCSCGENYKFCSQPPGTSIREVLFNHSTLTRPLDWHLKLHLGLIRGGCGLDEAPCLKLQPGGCPLGMIGPPSTRAY